MIETVKVFIVDSRDLRLHIRVSQCDIAMESLMAMTGASFSNGRLSLQGQQGAQNVRFCVGDKHVDDRIGED